MANHIRRAAQNFMLEVLWLADLEPAVRALGIRTDIEAEGPRMTRKKLLPLHEHRPGRATTPKGPGRGNPGQPRATRG